MTCEKDGDETKREVRLALLEQRVDQLEAAMQTILAKLDELITLKHKGEGSLWVLIAFGGIIGAVISKLPFFSRS